MPDLLTFALKGFSVAFVASLLLTPLCIRAAGLLGVVDKPGGRKQHGRVTPLFGGVAVFLACGIGLAVILQQAGQRTDIDLRFGDISQVLWGALVLFVIGLVDDIFKDSLGFLPKLVGQVIGVVVLTWPQPKILFSGGGTGLQWVYFVFLLLWYLTIVNSFNFSDNMNGLMGGLAVIAFAASVVYLGSQESLRSMIVASLLVGGLLGFLPYNFPRSRIFLGDTGSMFVGYWMAWVMCSNARGFLESGAHDFGINNLVPAVLIMGVPLYDAAYVVVRRVVEGRTIYLGDDRHLSHRLVRGGFSQVEAVVMLWGLGIVLAGVGILAAFSVPLYRYLLLGASFLLLVAVTMVVMALERGEVAREGGGDDADHDEDRGALTGASGQD